MTPHSSKRPGSSQLEDIAFGPTGATGSLWGGMYYCGNKEDAACFANVYNDVTTIYSVGNGWQAQGRDMPFTYDKSKWKEVRLDGTLHRILPQ